MNENCILHVCGPRGSFPSFGKKYDIFGHDTSCYVFRNGQYGLILDCGSGLTNAREYLKDCIVLDVLLSHVHYDHIMGLFQNRDFFEGKIVRFFGDFAAWQEAQQQEENDCFYKIEDLICEEMIQIKKEEIIKLNDHVKARFVTSNHPDSTCMIDVWVNDKHLCYSGDYEHTEKTKIKRWALGCDILLFDGSYNSEDYNRYKGWGHSSWEAGCEIASDCNVRQLIITHHAPCYEDDFLKIQQNAAVKKFRNVVFAKENEDYIL